MLCQSYFRQCCHRKLVPSCRIHWILEHPCGSWFVGRSANPDSCGSASHDLGHGGIFAFLGQKTESERCFWLETWTAEICTVLLASVLGQVNVALYHRVKTMFIQMLPQHAQSFVLHVTTPALPVCLFALAMILTDESTTIPENTSFEWNGIFTQRVKGYWYGRCRPSASGEQTYVKQALIFRRMRRWRHTTVLLCKI